MPLDATRQSPSKGKSLSVGRACKALTRRSRLSSSTPAPGRGSAVRVRAGVLGNAGYGGCSADGYPWPDVQTVTSVLSPPRVHSRLSVPVSGRLRYILSMSEGPRGPGRSMLVHFIPPRSIPLSPAPRHTSQCVVSRFQEPRPGDPREVCAQFMFPQLCFPQANLKK